MKINKRNKIKHLHNVNNKVTKFDIGQKINLLSWESIDIAITA